MTRALRRNGVLVARCTVERLMRELVVLVTSVVNSREA
ncbi:IS3 family transposase [Streptomyces sp. NPDC017943]